MPTLRIATANLLHGMTLTSLDTDAGALRDAIALLDADVLGIQEVDRQQPRSGEVDQTREAALALDAPWWRFVPAVHGTPGRARDWTPATVEDGATTVGPTYGIGLVSRLPVRRWLVRRFPAAPFGTPLLVPAHPRPRVMVIPDEPRIALAAVIDGPQGPLSVINVHLSFVPGFNVRQLRAITRWARAELPAPRFVIGDLNLPGNLPRLVSGWTSLARQPTYPVDRPRVQFDHVLNDGLGGWRVVAAGAQPMAISDHRAVTVSLQS